MVCYIQILNVPISLSISSPCNEGGIWRYPRWTVWPWTNSSTLQTKSPGTSSWGWDNLYWSNTWNLTALTVSPCLCLNWTSVIVMSSRSTQMFLEKDVNICSTYQYSSKLFLQLERFTWINQQHCIGHFYNVFIIIII